MSTESAPADSGESFAGRWWGVLLRGIIAIAFGILAFAWPMVTIGVLAVLFGCFALVDGVFSLLSAIGGGRYGEQRWMLVFEGVVGIWAGVLALRAPVFTAVALVLFISIWAMATGFLRIVAAIRLRSAISGEVWLALSGVLSVLFALMLMLRPAIGAITLVWAIAGYALIMGITRVMLV